MSSPPVVDVGRRLDLGLVRAQIVHRHDPRDDAGPRRQHGMVVGLDDGLSQRPVVQVGRAVPGQQPVGLGEVRVAQHRADRQRVPRGGEQQRTARRVFAQQRQRRLGQLLEVGVHPEAALRSPDRRLQVLGKALVAVPADCRGPRGHHGRDTGGERLVGCEGVVVGLSGRRVDEHARRAGGGAVLASVDGHHLVRLRQVDHHETAAARACDVRDRHAQRALRRHCSVDRVAAALEHVDPGLAGTHVHGRDGTPGSDGQRSLFRSTVAAARGSGRERHHESEG